MSKTRSLVCVLAVLAVSACAPIELVSQYDNQTDDAAAAMQKAVSTFFIALDTVGSPAEASFAANQDFYRKQAVNIDLMLLRAQNIPNNSLTIEQVQLLRDNLAVMALLHKRCVTGGLTDAQRLKVREKGIDASLACRTAYGATVDAPDRGDAVLNPALLPVVKGQLDNNLGLIMKFEMAKKRGIK